VCPLYGKHSREHKTLARGNKAKLMIEPKSKPPIEERQDFQLEPPSVERDSRHKEFRDLLERFYRWRWKQECPWGPAEGKQLKKLLDECPNLDGLTFRQWLGNYASSQDYSPGERPCRFLPRIHNYSQEPIDRFGRSTNGSTSASSAANYLDKKRNDRGVSSADGSPIHVASNPKRVGLRAMGYGARRLLGIGD
jgi:hypothetical protein